MSGRVTSRALVYPGHQAEVISILIDCWSGQGSQNVWVELYCLVEDSGNASQQVGSARRWLKEESEQAFGWVGGGSPLVRAFGSSDRRGSDRVLGRLFRTEV
jgi:hypothetical protein